MNFTTKLKFKEIRFLTLLIIDPNSEMSLELCSVDLLFHTSSHGIEFKLFLLKNKILILMIKLKHTKFHKEKC